jgi:hypothetical protein
MGAGEEAPVGCPIVSVFATLLWRRAVSNKAICRSMLQRSSDVAAFGGNIAKA